MVSREEYKSFVSNLVKKDLNNKNIKYLKKRYGVVSVLMFMVGVFVLFAGFPMTFGVDSGGLLFIVLGVCIIVLSIIRFVKRSKTTTYYKENYRETIINYLLSDYKHSFSSKRYIDEGVFRKSQFTGWYERYTGSDLLVINIPNDDGSESTVDLSLCDLNVTKTETDEDGDSRTVTVYGGVFGYVEFPFSFKCVLGINNRYNKGLKMEKVKLEDINFEKIFNVYSNDQIESRYILTPEMMEKLLLLNVAFKGLKVVLVDNRMYIGSSGTNLFELHLKKNKGVESLFDKIYDEMKMILEIINEIRNNNKIFKM